MNTKPKSTKSSNEKCQIVWSGSVPKNLKLAGWYYIVCHNPSGNGCIEFRDQFDLNACLQLWADQGRPIVQTVGRFG